MIIPIRCFTCGKVVADLWEPYMERLTEEYKKSHSDNNYTSSILLYTTDVTNQTIESKVLDELGITRFCCRRMLLTHVDLCNKI
jgi:DNA-directed RNA polymerase I, II, and III subunit RPABC5